MSRSIAVGNIRRNIPGIRTVVVNTISQDAKRFYQYFGFHESNSEPMTLMATLAEIRAASQDGSSG